jgi:hypothetical protein
MSSRSNKAEEDEVDMKIRKYEAFIDSKLRPDLEKVLRKRDTYYNELG